MQFENQLTIPEGLLNDKLLQGSNYEKGCCKGKNISYERYWMVLIDPEYHFFFLFIYIFEGPKIIF